MELCKKLKSLKHQKLAQRVFKAVCASYYKTIKVGSLLARRQDTEIFVNPGSSDIKTIRETTEFMTNIPYIRFIVDKNSKNLYIWNGEAGLHLEVARALNLLEGSDNLRTLYRTFLCGTALIVGNGMTLKEVYKPLDINEPDWSWAKHYFHNLISSSYFRTLTLYHYGNKQEIEIFTNPSPSDIKAIRNLSDEIRFIADDKQHEIYVWPGGEALHDQVADHLNLSGIHNSSNYLLGEASIKGSKLVLNNIYGGDYVLRDPRYDWIKNYMQV